MSQIGTDEFPNLSPSANIRVIRGKKHAEGGGWKAEEIPRRTSE